LVQQAVTLSSSALVLVGHGSGRYPDAARPVLALAESIRGRGLFAEVTAVFMKQDPPLAAALSLVSAPIVYVVPVFAGRGFYTGTLIPREIGLTGQVTQRDGRRVLYTEPAGSHPRLPGLLACRADGMAQACGWKPEETSLLLIAHGSSRPGGAGETPKAIAAALAGMNHFAEVQLCFLEQDPFAHDWPKMIKGGRVVALPLLVAQGLHAGQDIPPLFGLAPGETGPVDSHGRQVALATGLGAEPELEDIILDLVRGSP
jgi:sirohydrochlorin cobaltochelatase